MVYDPAGDSWHCCWIIFISPMGWRCRQDGDFVLVNETFDHRIMRYWLKGAKAWHGGCVRR
jgi:hypothetical protein